MRCGALGSAMSSMTLAATGISAAARRLLAVAWQEDERKTETVSMGKRIMAKESVKTMAEVGR